MITNQQSGTTIDEIAASTYRISTPLPPHIIPGGFSFNQYLIAGGQPVLFHSGPRAMFPLVREAIDTIVPAAQLRYISFSHFEADECGALNEFLSIAPNAQPLCSQIAALVSVNDYASRPARAMGDGEILDAGDHQFQWIDAPHLPHNRETGYLLDRTTNTLFCGDLFTQGGSANVPLTDGDILGRSEAFRLAGAASGAPDYFSHARGTRAIFEKLAALRSQTLACMHGSAWSNGREDGTSMMLMALADAVGASRGAGS